MTRPSLISIIPVAHPFNSIHLQAKMMHEALSTHFDTSPGLTLAPGRVPADITLVHYGSFDRHAGELARIRGAVFVFHGITPPREFLPWNPLVASRAVMGYKQLRALPRELGWIALSGASAATLRSHGFHNIEAAGCVIPTRRASVGRPGETRRPVLLFVGRISPNKRLVELLELFEHLHDLFPELTLSIVGGANKGCWYGRYFARRLRASRARSNVVWQSEPVRLSELQDLYQQALLYVSCSTHEGFGVPVLEAISFCTPAMYTACGGTESVLNGIGLLREQGPRERAEEIAGFIRNTAKRNALLALQRAFLPQFSSDSVGRMLKRALCRISGGEAAE